MHGSKFKIRAWRKTSSSLRGIPTNWCGSRSKKLLRFNATNFPHLGAKPLRTLRSGSLGPTCLQEGTGSCPENSESNSQKGITGLIKHHKVAAPPSQPRTRDDLKQ